ncbi:hypothetical protein [Chrysiogenes arsenatis]|uniref:hypothetical protein n=1 Tax=Chrysiogenes arsenatis TaxID=309797 RepID=UPI00040CE9E8|nr:hypothetical protein [Chrysiogenes arsenatis]
MADLILQNQLVSFFLLLVPIIGVTWKVFDVLFVKPRDFRIAVLEKNVEEIRKELQRTPQSEAASLPNTVPTAAVSATAEEAPKIAPASRLLERTTLLNNMNAFFESWKDKALTDLQRDQFERNYLGQKVVWRARLQSVSEEKNGLLWVSLVSEKERDYSVHVIAVFDHKFKEALLIVNKGEVVTVSGVLDSFSLSPLIKDCSIVRDA